MTTKETVEKYFEAIHKGGWGDYIADDFTFNANLDPALHGKAAYLEDAGSFFNTTTAVVIRQMLVDGDKAALIARYTVRSPKGTQGVCDVAEFLTASVGKLTASKIFFDNKSLEEFMTQG